MTSLPAFPFGTRPPTADDALALATVAALASPAVAIVTIMEATSSIARRLAPRHESRCCMLPLPL
jgi:hypothetical protein